MAEAPGAEVAARRPILGDMDPEDFRAAAHAAVDLMADYLASIESRAVFPAIEPGSLRDLVPGRRAGGPRAARARSSPTTAASSSRTPRIGSTRASWPTSRRPLGPRDPRRDADRGARPERDAVADLADRHGARGGRRRLAARGARAARRRSTACSPTPRRPRPSSRSPRPARRPASMPPARACRARRTCPRSASTPRPRRTARSRRRA